MAHALLTPGNILPSHGKLAMRDGDYIYALERRNGQPTYTVTNGADTLAIPIRWAFGAKSQTYVLEHGGRLYESRVSYYQAIDGLDITMGDQAIRPHNLVEAMGRELSAGEARACFDCHATRAIADDRIQTESLIAGIQCEHCHVGAEAHAEAISHGNTKVIPPSLAKLTAEDASNFCGRCHRSWSEVVRNRLFGPVNVRFQPYRLENSKCFDGSDARISCFACHDPHREVVRDVKSYDANCQACHAGKKPGAKACPVSSSGCVTCHMPKTELAGAHQVFTDHFIRVTKPNEPYPE